MDARGVPLSIIVTGANCHDVSQLAGLLDARVVGPLPDASGTIPPQNLCADAGYTGQPADQIIREHGYVPHVRSRKDEHTEKVAKEDYKPRRWVVEVSHSWFTRFRKLLVRYEKTASSFLALHHLAAAIIAFRKVVPLYGPYRKGTS